MAGLGANRGPYSLDAVGVSHRDTVTTTIFNSPTFDSLISDIDNVYEYEVGYVPAGYEHRPDLISNVFYGTPKNWWLLMLVNNISDPFEGFYLNQKILIPKL
jgi:hypothetical protein